MRRIVQIVPRFWPAIDGVGEFADQLGEQLQQRFGVETHFLVASSPAASRPHVSLLNAQEATTLTSALVNLDADLVLLHYSGYGYHERGIPRWLVEGLENFHSTTGIRSVVFFHELWASGPPWKSEFYLQGLQRQLVMRLKSIAQLAITSAPYMQRLLGPSSRRPLIVPIPSPVRPIPAVEARNAPGLKLVVFGLEHGRSRSLTAHAKLIRHVARQNLLESLVFIGNNARAAEAEVLGVVRQSTAIPDADAAAIRACLSSADALLSFYPAHLLTKSSSAMAALACGCPVILASAGAADGFVPQPPFMICNGSAAEIDSLLEARRHGLWADVAERALAWYEKFASWDCALEQLAPALGLKSSTEIAEFAT